MSQASARRLVSTQPGPLGRAAFIPYLSLGLAVLLGAWPVEGLAAPSVGPPVVFPPEMATGVPTLLTVTSSISTTPDYPLIENSVNLVRVSPTGEIVVGVGFLGVMRDDGASGDAKAGDGIFTLQLTLTETSDLRLRVVAAFRTPRTSTLSEVVTVPVRLDTAPPQLQIAPANGSTVNTTMPLIEIAWTDHGSGVNPSTLSLLIDGVNYSSSVVAVPGGAVYFIQLSGGQHLVTVRIRDRSGNEASTFSQFRVSAFTVSPEATPTSGPVPLTVRFTTKAEYTDGAILRYRWDFQGDGVYEHVDPGAQNYTFTYTQKGSFTATLEVLNSRDETIRATIPISVTSRPPVPSAGVNPSNGAVPLAVAFSGTATDPDGTIARYEWDVDGNGVFDFTSTTTGNTTHTYAAPGTFNAVFRVTDNDGTIATAVATATAVRVGPAGSPTATITAPNAPRTVVAPTTVAFSGTGSDPGGSIVRYEWDFNGDGTYEYSSATTAATSFQYVSPGTFTAALRVTDNAGLTGIDTVDITVNIAATLSIFEDNTCRPDQGGSATIRTTLGGSTRIILLLRNRQGQTVRTLLNGVDRAAGTYSDAWDCRTAAGDVVPEGVYYAVLQYLASGEVRSIDLTTTTGGALGGHAYVMEGNSCGNCPFRPLNDDLLDADFTLPSAAEMSLSIRLFASPFEEVVSIFDRKLFGTGTHRIQWDGADVQGRLVAPPPGGQFMFSLVRYTLPDNAIFVSGRPQITNVTADPNYFNPGTGDFVNPGSPQTTLSFTVSKPSTIVLQVFNTTTDRLVRTLSKTVGGAGADTIAWDGRTDGGVMADRGDYRLSLRAVDSNGNQSIVHYSRVRVFH
jgi:PKD repeat protein